MVRGLYTAYTGMINEQKRLDVISNNMANAATVGYKTERVSNQAFNQELTLKIKDTSVAYNQQPIGHMSLGVKVGEVYTDYSQGSLRETEATFDLALEGSGFFQISYHNRDGSTSTKFTRDGSFTMTSDGYVVDMDGNNLVSQNGVLQVPPDAVNIVIDESGYVYADEQLVDRIVLVDYQDYDFIEKFGENMYQTVLGATPVEATAKIRQGFTEQSNVNAVNEMVDLITVTRAYEAGQKVINTIDMMTDKAVNDIGRV